MKALLTGSLLLLFSITLSPKSAHAVSFVDSVSFSSGADPFVNIAYTASQSSGFLWTHDFRDILTGQDLSLISFSNAVLTVVYSRTNLEELWQIEGTGNLGASFNEITGAFALAPPQLEDLKDGLLTFKLKELTSGADSMRMHSALLRGNYEVPVNKVIQPASIPEPGSLVMAFLSFLGLFYAERIK